MKNFILLIPLLAIMAIGYILTMIIQPWLFTSGLITFNLIGGDIDKWIRYEYSDSAMIVFVLSSLASFIWFGIALYYNDKDRQPGIQFMRLIWGGLSFIPVLSIIWSLSIFQEGKDASGALLLLFPVDGILLFWLGTALSTPESFKYGVIPGSYYLRHLLRF
jgi:hypothetical protein